MNGKNGRMKIESNACIVVKIQDLNKKGHSAVTKICDICNIRIDNQKYCQVISSREKGDGLDRCKPCSYLITGDRMRLNMKFEDSFEAYATMNGKEHLLKEYSVKNIHSTSKIKPFSTIECIWNCFVCGSEYTERPQVRCSLNTNCPYCAGSRVNQTNSLFSLRPDIASQWHPTKNNSLTPHNVTLRSNKKVWWLGECGHEWEAMIDKRTSRSQNCPYCSNVRVLVGYNDMWTTNPHLAKHLLNRDDGYMYTQASDKILDWRCIECENVIKDKKIYDIYRNGLSCPSCSDGLPFTEKVVYNMLKQLEENFNWEKTFDWLPNKRYDFYVPDKNIIIEVHGGQHYTNGFESLGGDTLKKVKENDKLKEEKAVENSINNYIIINASISDIDFIKTNIENSALNNIYDLSFLDWKKVNRDSLLSLVVEVCSYWNEGIEVENIATKVKLSNTTIRSYLNKGTRAGLCNFTGHNIEVVQLSLEGSFVREWKSMTEASRYIGYEDVSPVSQCCRGKRLSAGGYRWMKKKDYIKGV